MVVNANSSSRKPMQLALGETICDAMSDDEDTLLAVFATSQGVWLNDRDMTEMNDIRFLYKTQPQLDLGVLSRRAVDVLRHYLPEMTTFVNTVTSGGLMVMVKPDAEAIGKAEHDRRTLERGGFIPTPTSNKVKYWLVEQSNMTLLYKRSGTGKGLKHWTLMWEYKEV